jgi:hypothetical protein
VKNGAQQQQMVWHLKTYASAARPTEYPARGEKPLLFSMSFLMLVPTANPVKKKITAPHNGANTHQDK